LKPDAFKLWVNWIELLYSPTSATRMARLRFRSVAVQVDPFETPKFETRFSLHRLKGCGKQALSRLWVSTAFNLYSPRHSAPYFPVNRVEEYVREEPHRRPAAEATLAMGSAAALLALLSGPRRITL
jgi:hypothetical protein